MVLQYVYHDEKSTLSVDWHDINGKFTIHTTIVERLTSRHGNSFKEYKMAAQELDRKVDKLYQSIWIFSDEHYAIPYDPKNRDRLLRAFTDFCTCLETEIASDRSPQAQVLLHIYQAIQNTLQRVVGIYLADHAYQNKHFKRSRKLEIRTDAADGPEPAYEFETALLQMLDLSRKLEQLSKPQRQRIVKRFILGHTYQQIAEQEGVSIQAVRDSILSALKKLRMLL